MFKLNQPIIKNKVLTWSRDLTLDADEYLYPETCEEVKRLVADGGLPPDVTSLSLSRATYIWWRDSAREKD
mgnify:CR=1 FL=1